MPILACGIGDRILRFSISGDKKITVGSLPENSICLPFSGVSRHHFAVGMDQGCWCLEDLGSRNGTLVNEKKTARCPLKPGDVIQAGMMHLVFLDGRDEDIVEIPDSLDALKKTSDFPRTADKRGDGEIFFLPGLQFPEGTVLGRSPAMVDVYQLIQRAARSDSPVLFIGETGTGKEVFARTLHLSGKRAKGPFIPVNCAAIPRDLVEAELFGIEERVATDVGKRKGKFTLADGGTLFLDEVNAFPYDLQAKILRAVEGREIHPVGADKPVLSDFRIIAALNREPEDLLDSGKLRNDLYHRIATLEIRLPPLRKRDADIPCFTRAFLAETALQEGKPIGGLDRKVLQILQDYPYPGNVRELHSILRAMVIVANPGEILDLHHVPARLLASAVGNMPSVPLPAPNAGGKKDLHKLLADTAHAHITQALKTCGGNVTRTADYLGVSRKGLQKMMTRLGIKAGR